MRLKTVPMLAALTLLNAGVALAAPFAVEVTAGALNVRTQAYGRVLNQVAVGDRFVAHENVGGWLRIDYMGRQAWISASYVKRITATAARVNVGSLNVRSGASTAYGVMGVASQNQMYVVRGESNGWRLIQLDHRYGYVAGQYVSLVTLNANGSSSGSTATSSGGSTSSSGSSSGSSNPRRTATAAELEVMARIIKGEAGVTSYEGKVAVGAVILNRVEHARFPSTIIGVCHQPYQFSCYNANFRNQLYWGSIPAEAWQAARDALNGTDPTGNAQYYFNPYLVRPSWASTLSFTRRIGTRRIDTHDFYKIRGT